MSAGRRRSTACTAFLLVSVLACAPAALAPPARDRAVILFGNSGYRATCAIFADHADTAGLGVSTLDAQVTDSRRFYRDASLAGGADDDPDLGAESSLLAFYVGHGRPDDFDAYEDGPVYLGDLQLGDGNLRYWWMASCLTMAHGPFPYSKPQEFDPRDNSSQNVFRRWARTYPHQGGQPTTPVGSQLRMACGGSTPLIVPKPDSIRGLWEDLVTEAPRSDAFIMANTWDDSEPKTPRVPLCITRGGSCPETSTLWDSTFETEPNPHGDGGFVFIQYPVSRGGGDLDADADWLRLLSGADDPPPAERPQPDPPDFAPILRLAPLPIPEELRDSFLNEGAVLEAGFRKLSLVRVLEILGVQSVVPGVQRFGSYYHPCSGKLVVRGPAGEARRLEVEYGPESEQPSELDPTGAAVLALLFQNVPPAGGPSRREPSHYELTDHYVDRATQAVVAGGGTLDDIRRFRKSRIGEVVLGVRIENQRYPVLGEGGRLRLVAGGYGSLGEVSIAARQVTGFAVSQAVMKTETARKIAIDKVEAGGWDVEDEAPSHAWGYLEAPASCFQREMGIVHRFTFEPTEGEDALALVVDVQAQDVEPPVCVGDLEWRAAPDLPAGCVPNRR